MTIPAMSRQLRPSNSWHCLNQLAKARIHERMTEEDLLIKVEGDCREALVRVIDIVPGQIIIKESRA